MSTPPDKRPNGARLAGLADGLRRNTPITTQGEGGSFWRTPRGYTTPHMQDIVPLLPPWHFYERSGFLYLTPGLVNGQCPTTEDGTPLDSDPPPPLISIEDLLEQERWFMLEAVFDLNVKTLQWPEYNEELEIIGYTAFPSVVDGSTLNQLMIRVLDEQPAPIDWPIGGVSQKKRANTATLATFHLNGDFPTYGQSVADLTAWPLLGWPAIDTRPYARPAYVEDFEPDLGSFRNVDLQTDNFAQFSRFNPDPP